MPIIRSNAGAKSLEAFLVRAVLSWVGLRRDRTKTSFPAEQSPARWEPLRLPHDSVVLLCKTCCLGDAVLSLYALRDLKTQRPDLRLHLLSSLRVAEVYAASGLFADIAVLPARGKGLLAEVLRPAFLLGALRLFFKLRKERFALLLDLEVFHAYPVLVRHALGIPAARGFAAEGSQPRDHEVRVLRGRTRPEWECYFDLLGLPVPSRLPLPLFPLTRPVADAASASDPDPGGASTYARDPGAASAPDAGPVPDPGLRLGLVPGASFNWPQKKWPLPFFAEIVTRLTEEGVAVTLLGGAEDLPEAEELLRLLPEPARRLTRTVVGSTDFSGLRRELAACKAVFGNDTGPLHVAAALGLPTVTLFGPTEIRKWNPLTSVPVFRPELACRPCYYLGAMPACAHRRCLKELRPADALPALRAALAPFA